MNIGADFKTLEVVGREHIRIYRALIAIEGSDEISESLAERSFCSVCGSAIWLWDPRWPDQLHPHASAIDTELPEPPKNWHMMLEFKASWVSPCLGANDREFEGYPDESLVDWHLREALT